MTTATPEKFWMFHPVDASDPWVDIEAELNDPDFVPHPDLLTLIAASAARLNAIPVSGWEFEYVHAEFDDDGKQIERTGGIQAHCMALRSNDPDLI